MRVSAAKNWTCAKHDADLVVEQGIATKNRYGQEGVLVPLPNGCYKLTRIETPRRKIER